MSRRAPTPPEPQRRRLRRLPAQGMICGLCAGIAARLGTDPGLVRAAAVLLTVLTSGLGLILYVVGWVTVPPAADPDDPRPPPRHRPGLPRGGAIRLGAGVALLALAVLLAFREAGVWWSDALVWPLVLVLGGAALIWRQVSGPGQASQPELLEGRARAAAPVPPQPTRPGRTRLRGGFGIALVVAGALLFLAANGTLTAASDSVVTVLVVAVAAALILAPFWVRLIRNLNAERRARIRSQERAEVAAHLHDSVLQTLALIQRRAGEDREISALARRQERELRDWLSGRGGEGEPGGMAAAIEQVTRETEEAHDTAIELVVVGDRPLSGERELAVIAATREAATNAARFAAGERVDVYAEFLPDRAEVFVRDRGPGFDLDAVPADRRGVRESILGRMHRHGGEAEVRAVPGSGTEVELTMEFR